MLPLSDFDHVHCLFSFYLYSNLDTSLRRALGFLLLRMVIKDFPSFEDQRRNWARFNRLLQGELDDLRERQLPAEFQVDLLCELIEASLQEKPEDRCAGNYIFGSYYPCPCCILHKSRIASAVGFFSKFKLTRV